MVLGIAQSGAVVDVASGSVANARGRQLLTWCSAGGDFERT